MTVKKIAVRSNSDQMFKLGNGEQWIHPTGTYVLVNETDLMPNRTIDGGGFTVLAGEAQSPDSGAVNTGRLEVRRA